MNSRTTIGAYDLGASGGKFFVGVFDNDTFTMHEIHRFEHAPVPVFIQQDDTVSSRLYWNDLLLYQNIIEGLNKYRRQFADRLDSLGIDTWGADGQFFTKDGDALDHVYSYRDYRLNDMVDQLKAVIDAKEVYRKTGIHFWPFNVSNQIYWFRKYRPELFKQADVYLSIAGIFYYYLCGAKMTEYTWASVTQLLDAHTRTWCEEMFRAIDVPSSIMAPIVQPGVQIGTLLPQIAEQVGLNRAKVITAPTHDTASAFASAPVVNEAEALIISSGTWSLIGKLVPEPILTDQALVENFSNEGGVGNIRFLRNSMGTWPVQELRRIWKDRDGVEMSWDQITEAAQQGASFTYFIDPDDPCFYNPRNMEQAIQDYCRSTGQAVPTRREDILNAVYESLALKYAVTNETLEQITGKRTEKVHIVGGGARNKLLNQYTANAVGRDVEAGPFEATAVGNVMVQAVGLGLIKDLKQAIPIIKAAFPPDRYRPADQSRWQQALGRFKELIRSGQKYAS